MDIWAWVSEAQEAALEKGQHRLAALINQVPSMVGELAHEGIDAVMPEAIALARQAKSPWLEVFFRHWHLQSLVFRRMRGGEVLKEAVALLEFAHRDEAKGCPQSVCVTQDLAHCYANVDGPGYAKERIAVADEALARITPMRSCFNCISAERADALIDDGRPAEARDYLLKQEAVRRRAGGPDSEDLLINLADAYLALGEYLEAIEVLDRAAASTQTEAVRRDAAVRKAWALAATQRLDEAKATLPSVEDVMPTPSLYRPYAKAMATMVRAGVYENGFRVHCQLLDFETTLQRDGVWRAAFEMAALRGELALERKRPRAAEHACESMSQLLLKLRAPLGADLKLAGLREQAAKMRATVTAPELPKSVDDLLSALGDDPETDLELLDAGQRQWPQDERLRCAQADALVGLGHLEESERLLRGHLEGAPQWSAGVVGRLNQLLSDAERFDDARAVLKTALSRAADVHAQHLFTRWLASAAEEVGDLEGALIHLRKAFGLERSAELAARLARLERQSGQLEPALRLLEEAAQEWPEVGAHDWERMIVGTLLERWPSVRQAAHRLGFELEGGGPIDEQWEPCLLLFDDSDEAHQVLAMRTGPVTARVLTVARPERPQHVGDHVVFDPKPLNEQLAEETHVDERQPSLFAAIQIVQPGQYEAFSLEGVDPGDDAFEKLREALSTLGVRITVFSDESYQVATENDEPLTGLYARMGVPPNQPLDEVNRLLKKTTAPFEHPLAWPQLLKRLGDEAGFIAHCQALEKYGISFDA